VLGLNRFRDAGDAMVKTFGLTHVAVAVRDVDRASALPIDQVRD
jgi:hypothetical protein